MIMLTFIARLGLITAWVEEKGESGAMRKSTKLSINIAFQQMGKVSFV